MNDLSITGKNKSQYSLPKVDTGSLAGHLIADPERTSPDKTSVQKRIFHAGQGNSADAVREGYQRYISSRDIPGTESDSCVKQPDLVVFIDKCTFYALPKRHGSIRQWKPTTRAAKGGAWKYEKYSRDGTRHASPHCAERRAFGRKRNAK